MIGIEPYSDRHRDGVVAVILPIQQEEFGIPVTLGAQPDLLDIPGFYQRGAGNFWVALSDGEIVGTIALLDIGSGQGALRKMFVKAPLRGPGPGVARRLLDTLLQWCAAHGVKEVYLGTTSRFLAAHRFYEKNGFAEIPKSGLPPAFPVMSVDTRFYRRVLGGRTEQAPSHRNTGGRRPAGDCRPWKSARRARGRVWPSRNIPADGMGIPGQIARTIGFGVRAGRAIPCAYLPKPQLRRIAQALHTWGAQNAAHIRAGLGVVGFAARCGVGWCRRNLPGSGKELTSAPLTPAPLPRVERGDSCGKPVGTRFPNAQ